MDGLGEALERLEDRLRPVLDGPTVGWPAQAPQPAGPPLVEDLRSVSARLEVLYGRLLYRQHAAMTELAFVLAARIQRFKPVAADSEGGEV